MQIRKNSKKFTSDYVFIKNDKLGYLAGLFLLIVTAAATILGIAPQDIKKFSGYWWYELIINIVAIIVLIGLGVYYQASDVVKKSMALHLTVNNGSLCSS